MSEGKGKPVSEPAETEEERQDRFWHEPGTLVVDISKPDLLIQGAILRIVKYPEHPREAKRVLYGKIILEEVDTKALFLPSSYYRLRIGTDTCQRLANQLWELGAQPVAAKGSAGQLAAVQKHLDMLNRLVENLETERDLLLEEVFINSSWMRESLDAERYVEVTDERRHKED